ncbi:ABC transporter ATP-binding protein/permease [Candidatus Gracilibacteria bacterium]|nr:ABC transporter ATP-binding protein/permease [Candidatus Gracilibacteria bacterium]
MKYAKYYSFQQVFKGVTSWSTPFVHIFFIQKIITILEAGNQQEFKEYLFYYLLYVIFYEIVSALTHNWGWFSADPEYRKHLGNKYIGKYIKLDSNVIERVGTGKSISIIDKGIETWSTGLTLFLWYGSGLLASFTIACVYLSGIHYGASVIFISIFVFSLLFSHQMNKRMISFRKKRNKQVHLHTKHLVKIIMSKMEVMQGNKINYEQERLSTYMDKSLYYNLRMAPYFHCFYHTPYFLIILLKLGFLYYVSSFIFSGELSIASFVGLFGVMLILEETTMRFIDFFKQLAKDYSMIEYLWDFFDTTPEIEGYETGSIFKHKSGTISLKNINYSYDTSKPVFQDFSLDIPGNRITALVGPSGGGKSTLVKLVSGYIRQDGGDIIVDGQNLSDVSLKSYYGDVGYLTQEPSVFDGTIEENLLYAVRKKPTKKHIGDIIKLAHCEFIYDLPMGLKTEIGERGIKLSGGQKQRLAIAKIFLKNPKIIILDEPTSALDSISEQKITQAMHNLFKNRTVIVIAHRLQTVKHADDIVVIEGGEIKERGTHASLVRKKGFYKQMLDLQSGF